MAFQTLHRSRKIAEIAQQAKYPAKKRPDITNQTRKKCSKVMKVG